MLMKTDRLFYLIAFILIIGLSGCSNKTAVQSPVAQKATAPAPVLPADQSEEVKIEKEVYSYEAQGRRDPFMSLIVDIKEKPLRRKKANPVENFDVDEIKLIAIVSDKNSSYAMITLPDGKSYTIKKGMTLGLYGGRVEDIAAKTVRITEQVKNYRGQTVTKDTTLKLREEGE